MFKKILDKNEDSSHASNDIGQPGSLNESGHLRSSVDSDNLLESREMTAVFNSSEIE